MTHANPMPDAYSPHQGARFELAAEVLHRFGEVRIVVHGSSMIPSIYPGDLLTVRSEAASHARCGDVVLCLLGGRFLVHRVMRKWPERSRTVFATRGDALSQEDPSVDASQLLGRVTSIFRYGKPRALPNHLGPWTKFLRWAVQHSQSFATTLLAVHALRARILGGSPQQPAPPPKRLQEFA